MKNNRIRMSVILLALFGIVGTVVSMVAATTTCYTWNDPPCTTATWVGHDCQSCKTFQRWPVTNHGTHWVCVVVGSGWPECVTDTACVYTVSHTCPACQFINGWPTPPGPLDQLISGGNCP